MKTFKEWFDTFQKTFDAMKPHPAKSEAKPSPFTYEAQRAEEVMRANFQSWAYMIHGNRVTVFSPENVSHAKDALRKAGLEHFTVEYQRNKPMNSWLP